MVLYRRRPPWRIASFSSLFLLCLIVICLAIWPCAGKGGRGGGGRGGGSRGGSSSRGSSWGSSSRSGSSSRTSYSSGSGSSSRWGSSQSSGSSRYSYGGGYGSRPSYSGGAAYRAPSKTMSRISSPSSSYSAGAAKSSYPRAQAHIPAASGSYATRVVYTPVYSSYPSYRRGYSGTNMAMAAVGGYALGSMMSRPYHSGYGYPYYGGGYYYGNPYAGYVPYRDRYHDYLTTTTPGPTTTDYNQAFMNSIHMVNCFSTKSFDECYYTTTSTLAPPKPKEIDLCTLARWNRELPYAEVPNMALMFLSNDTVSGNTTSDKAKFAFEFFKELPRAYAAYNSTGDIFTIPASYDLRTCNMQSTEGADVTQNATGTVEEPILTAARNMIMLYSNISKTPDNLPDVVAAAKACLPRSDNPPYPKILPCLEYSLAPDQLVSLSEAKSVFGNGEICRKQLNLDVEKCLPAGETAGDCHLEHLVALNLFARNYYLCTAELEEDTARRIRERADKDHREYQEWLLYNSGSHLSAGIVLPGITASIIALISVILTI